MSATLKVYSQNVCVLPVGGREQMLQTSSLVGSVLFLPIFASAALLGCDVLLLFSIFVFVIITALFCPIGYFLVSPLWAGSNLFADDFKSERLSALASRLSSSPHKSGGPPLYDIVMLQEFFGCFYSDRHRQHFTALMTAKGYPYSCLPPCSLSSTFPSLWGNSGLAIFSPHPLSSPTFHTFKNQLFYDYWLVNRGILGVKVHVPLSVSSTPLSAFSVHFGPPVSVLTLFSFVPAWLTSLVDVFDKQTSELVELVSSYDDGRLAVVGGDFNAPAAGPAYNRLKASLSCIGLYNTGPSFELPSAKPTANPPGETLLTKGLRTPKVLDYVFAAEALTKGRRVSCIVGDMRVKNESRFEMISDHAPVETTFEVLVAKSKRNTTAAAARSRSRSRNPSSTTSSSRTTLNIKASARASSKSR